MPVFHFILHAYGSWHPDHPDGWHQHGLGIPLQPQPRLAKFRRQKQRWDPAHFQAHHHLLLSDMARDICSRRDWRCLALAINDSHFHIIASWFLTPPEAIDLQKTFKRVLAWQLAKITAIQGRRWFSDGGLPKPVADLQHLHYLVHEYLPDQGGHFWSAPRFQRKRT